MLLYGNFLTLTFIFFGTFCTLTFLLFPLLGTNVFTFTPLLGTNILTFLRFWARIFSFSHFHAHIFLLLPHFHARTFYLLSHFLALSFVLYSIEYNSPLLTYFCTLLSTIWLYGHNSSFFCKIWLYGHKLLLPIIITFFLPMNHYNTFLSTMVIIFLLFGKYSDHFTFKSKF